MTTIIVLGAGLVGKPMMLDLLADNEYEIAICDRSEALINTIKKQYGVQGFSADLSKSANVKHIIKDFDFVINAVPGFMGYSVLKSILEAGKNVVDIAFSPEDLSPLDKIAKENGVTALVDFGVAPGLSHMIVAHASTIFDKLDKVRIFVGGLPKRRSKPFEYNAVFSPIDVIEEYTRPARLVQNGKTVIKEALTEIESLEFDRVGTLEAFNSDGLRSLVDSIEAVDMAEKTLRYPGHADLMKTLRDLGYFSEEAIEINGTKIKPIDLSAKLIFPQWEMKENDRDITVMKIFAEGPVGKEYMKYEFDLFDEFDESKMIHSMARTTGYTATMGMRVLINEKFNKAGVFYPEKLGVDNELLNYIVDGLIDRGVNIQQKLYVI